MIVLALPDRGLSVRGEAGQENAIAGRMRDGHEPKAAVVLLNSQGHRTSRSLGNHLADHGLPADLGGTGWGELFGRFGLLSLVAGSARRGNVA